MPNNEDYLTKQEANNIYVSKDECNEKRMEVLERLMQEENKNKEQDYKITTLEKGLDKINNGISKIAWIGVAIIVETLLGLIIK